MEKLHDENEQVNTNGVASQKERFIKINPESACFCHIELLPMSELFPDPEQPRKYFDVNSHEDLKSSIDEHGIQMPLLYRLAEGKKTIVSGERRYNAAKALGLTDIPARLVKEDFQAIALVDNIQRDSLLPMELALAIRKFMKVSELEQKDVAKKLGKGDSTISEMLKPCELPQHIQEAALLSPFWSRNRLLKLAKIKDTAEQKAAFEKMRDALASNKTREKQGQTDSQDKAPTVDKEAKLVNKVVVFRTHIVKLRERFKNKQTIEAIKKDDATIRNELLSLKQDIEDILGITPPEQTAVEQVTAPKQESETE